MRCLAKAPPARVWRWLVSINLAILLAACFNTLDWREFHSPEGRFSVSLPGKVQHEQRTLTTPMGVVQMHMDSTSAGTALFGVGYADYPAGYFARVPVDSVIGNLRDQLVKNIGGVKPVETPVNGRNYRGIGVHAESPGERKLILDARLLVAGDRLYQVLVISEAKERLDNNALDLYFNSFRVTE